LLSADLLFDRVGNLSAFIELIKPKLLMTVATRRLFLSSPLLKHVFGADGKNRIAIEHNPTVCFVVDHKLLDLLSLAPSINFKHIDFFDNNIQ